MHYECHTKNLTELWASEDRDLASEDPQLLYGDCMEPGCIGKSNTNNLPAPTDMTENPYGKKKLFLFWGESKIGLHGTMVNCIRVCTMEPDF